MEEALDLFLAYRDINDKQKAMKPGDALWQRCFGLEMAHVVAHVSVMSHSDKWALEGGEAALVSLIDGYDVEIDGPACRSFAFKQNWMFSGMFVYMLALHYGALPAVATWHRKALAGLHKCKLDSGRDYAQDPM